MSHVAVLDALSGATRVYPIIGDPIAQVKSPAGVTRGFNERGVDAVVVPAHVTPQDLDAYIEMSGRVKNIDGMIITIPHKIATYRHCASTSQRSAILGVVNVLRRNADGSWHGDMTDGEGMVASIRRAGGEPSGRRALLVGIGGAGLAIAQSLLDAGVTELAIHDADQTRLRNALAVFRPHYGERITIGTNNPAGFGLVVNATPMGMRSEDPLPVDVSQITPDTFAACVITVPAASPWIVAARAKGCATSVGTDMFEMVQGRMIDFFLEA